MVLASGTTLSWRPLPPLRRPSSLLVSYSAGVKSARVSTLSASTCPRPRRRWSSSGGCRSLSSFILRNSLSSSFLDVRLICSRPNLERRRKRSRWGAVTTRVGMRLDPSGGGGNEGGIVRLIVNLCLAGALTYLTVTDKLGWVFDTLVSLWLLAVLVPIISFVAFVWFAEREIVKGACPNCGQEFQVFEFAVKEQSNRCPYCSQPFKMDNGKQFVRDEPRFSSQKSNGFTDAFGGFGSDPSRKKGDPGGVIVDVEAEIMNRD